VTDTVIYTKTINSRLDDLERRADSCEDQHLLHRETNDNFRREVAEWRAEAKARDDAQASAISSLSSDVRLLTVELAKNTGAQEAKARIDEQSIRNWKKAAVIFGIIFGFITMVSGIALSQPNFTTFISYSLHSPYKPH